MSKNIKTLELSNNWIWVKLSDITVPVKRTNRDYENPNKEFKYIDIEAIDNNSQTIKNLKTYTWSNAPSRAQQIVQVDDILFATIRPYLKNIALISLQQNDVIASSGFCVLRTIIVNPKFIFYYISSQVFIDLVNQFSKGTSYPAVTNKVVLEQKVPLPSLEEQTQIVNKIEELFGELDIAEKTFFKIQKKIKIYKQVILRSAFNGELTHIWRETNTSKSAVDILSEIAIQRKSKYDLSIQENKKGVKKDYDFEFTENTNISGWAVVKLDKLISINARVGWKGLKKEEYTSKGPLFLSVHCLNYGKYVEFKDAYHITEERYDESPEIKLAVNDILLCKDGAGIGKIGVIKHLPEKATINSSLIIIRGNEAFVADYLY